MRKIHTKIVFNTATGDVLEDHFYWYDGPVDECKTSLGDVIETSPVAQVSDVLFPTPEAVKLPEASSQAVDDFTETVDTLEDFQLLQQGFIKVQQPDGGFAIQRIPDNLLNQALGTQAADQLRSRRSVELLTTQRLEAALRGDLPVSPAFEREAEERTAQTALAVKRGPGELSTPGSQKIFQQQFINNLLRDQIRRGEISSAQGVNLQQQQVTAGIQNQILQNIQGGRFGVAQLGLQQQGLSQELQLAQLLANLGQQAGQQQLKGQIGSAAIPAIISAASAASDIRLKENIKELEPAMDKIEKMNPVTFDFKADKRPSAGFIAQEMQEIIPEAVIEIDDEGTLGIDYTIVMPFIVKSVQELNEKISKL